MTSQLITISNTEDALGTEQKRAKRSRGWYRGATGKYARRDRNVKFRGQARAVREDISLTRSDRDSRNTGLYLGPVITDDQPTPSAAVLVYSTSTPPKRQQPSHRSADADRRPQLDEAGRRIVYIEPKYDAFWLCGNRSGARPVYS